MIKIIIDVFSGDDPKALIRGTAAAVNVYPDVKVIMPGDPTYLERELALCDYDTKRLEILPASEVIGNDDLGIVNNITSIISKEEKISLRSISIDSHDGLFSGNLTVMLDDTGRLQQLIRKLKTIKGVKQVARN